MIERQDKVDLKDDIAAKEITPLQADVLNSLKQDAGKIKVADALITSPDGSQFVGTDTFGAECARSGGCTSVHIDGTEYN